MVALVPVAVYPPGPDQLYVCPPTGTVTDNVKVDPAQRGFGLAKAVGAAGALALEMDIVPPETVQPDEFLTITE